MLGPGMARGGLAIALGLILSILLVWERQGKRTVALSDELLVENVTAGEGKSVGIKRVEAEYEARIGMVKKAASQSMQAEEKAMLKSMEQVHANEEATIGLLRRQEERREAVVMAHEKAREIEAAMQSVEMDEQKKVSALKAKLAALHHREETNLFVCQFQVLLWIQEENFSALKRVFAIMCHYESKPLCPQTHKSVMPAVVSSISDSRTCPTILFLGSRIGMVSTTWDRCRVLSNGI